MILLCPVVETADFIILLCTDEILSSVCALSLSPVRLFATPWTVAHQAPVFRGFPRREYWSGLPFLSTGELPDPGKEPRSLESLELQVNPLLFDSSEEMQLYERGYNA